MLSDRSKKALLKKARKGFTGYPVATIAFYGPSDRIATKVVAAVVRQEDCDPDPMRKWFSDSDLRSDAVVLAEVLAFMREHGVRSVTLAERIIGCPHEEGVDYPLGETCPQCPFWKGRDRWSGQRQH